LAPAFPAHAPELCAATFRVYPRGRSVRHRRAACGSHRSACWNVCALLILDTSGPGCLLDCPIKFPPLQPERSYAPYPLFHVRAPGIDLDTPLVAQQPTGTIRGRITDTAQQQPIIGVVVTVAAAVPSRRAALTLRCRSGSRTCCAPTDRYQRPTSVMVAGGDTVVVDVALNRIGGQLVGVVVTDMARSARPTFRRGHDDADDGLLCAVVCDASANGAGGLLRDERRGPGQCQERAHEIMDTAHTTSQAVTVET